MRLLFTVLFCWLAVGVFSQNMLLVEKPGTVKNYKYFAGDQISLQTKSGEKISGPINIIRDSNLIVDFTHELLFSDIEVVYQPRVLVKLLSSALIVGSAVYIGLDFINGGSRGKSFSENKSLQTSAAILASGIGLSFLGKKRMHIEKKKWRIRVLPPLKK